MVFMHSHPIDGTWLPLKAELEGECAPGMALEKMRLVIAAGTYAVHFGGSVADSGSIRFAHGEGHASFTLLCTHGENAGRSVPSIFQLAGDRLRICFGLGGSLPAAFTSTPGSGHYLVTYRRVDAAAALGR